MKASLRLNSSPNSNIIPQSGTSFPFSSCSLSTDVKQEENLLLYRAKDPRTRICYARLACLSGCDPNLEFGQTFWDGNSTGSRPTHACNATNLASELYNSNQAAGNADVPGGAVKFSVPPVANGRVYVGSQASLSIYGLFASRNAPPTFSPTPETYPSAQAVSISDASPGTTIYYTTDGSTPTTSSTVYSTPITVSTTTTIKAIAAGGTLSQSTVASASYAIQSQATPPTFSPAPGPFQAPMPVTLLDNSAGVTIYYTTDGSVPTTSSTLFTLPIPVSTTTTIKAIAAGGGFTTSPVASGVYVLAAPIVNFIGGFNGAGMTLNGASSYSGSRLRLTDGGTFETASAYYSTPVNVRSFTTDFSFQLSNPSADGMTFTIQGSGLTALGGYGGDLGYGPNPNVSGSTGILNSVAIKFDLYDNAGEGNNSTGLYTNGAQPFTPAIDLTSSGIDLHSGDLFNVHISYDGATLTMSITDAGNSTETFTQSWPIDIPAIVGANTAYVGFTAGTGGVTAIQDILNWSVTLGGMSFSPPGGLLFPVQTVGTTSLPLAATLSNSGTTPVYISTFNIAGANAGDFAIKNNPCPVSPNALAVGASCLLDITFSPTASGPRKTALTITDSTANTPLTLILTGVGTLASLSPTSLTFTNQTTSTTSAPQVVTLTNVGSTTMNVWQIAISGPNASDFSEVTTCGSTLGPGASCSVHVTFTPSAIGARGASLLFSDDAGGSPQSVSLTGTGVAPAGPSPGAQAPSAQLSTSTVVFAKQSVGTTSPGQTVVFSNTGGSPLAILGISISGLNSDDFAQTNTCGSSLSPSETCTIMVFFSPRARGNRSGVISITDSAAGSPHGFSVRGIGIEP